MASPKTEANKRGLGNKVAPERLEFVEALFTGLGPKGRPHTTREIENAVIKEYGVCRRQAQNYLTVVRRRLAAASAQTEQNPDALIEQTDALMLDAYRIAKQKGDVNGMVLAAQRRAELRGVFKRQVNIEGKFTGLADALASVMGEANASASTQPTHISGGAKTLAE